MRLKQEADQSSLRRSEVQWLRGRLELPAAQPLKPQTSASRGRDKRAQKPAIFAARSRFNAARHIHSKWTDRLHCGGHVFRCKTSGQDHAQIGIRLDKFPGDFPGKCPAASAKFTRARGIEHDGAREKLRQLA